MGFVKKRDVLYAPKPDIAVIPGQLHTSPVPQFSEKTESIGFPHSAVAATTASKFRDPLPVIW